MNRREALTTGSYGIITGLDNTVTAVISRRHILIIIGIARLAARTHSRHTAQSGSRAVRSDRSPVCATAARREHRSSDRNFLLEFGGWLATNAPARAAAEVPREMRATAQTHLCSSRPQWDRRVSGNGVPAASRRIYTHLAEGHGYGQRAQFPATAITARTQASNSLRLNGFTI